MSKSKEPKIKKVWLRYVDRCRKGQRILRMSNGNMFWTDGRTVSVNAVREMLSNGMLVSHDADLFGDVSRGQTIGLPA